MAGGLPKWVVLKDRPSDRRRIGFCKNWQCSIRQGWLQRNTMQHGWIALNSPTMWAKADLLVEHNELKWPRQDHTNNIYQTGQAHFLVCKPSGVSFTSARGLWTNACWSYLPQTRFHDAYVGNHPRNPAKALLLVFFVGRALWELSPGWDVLPNVSLLDLLCLVNIRQYL